jgi:mono/diheme cytochrome c family protein
MTNGQGTCLLGALLTAVVLHSPAQTHPPPEPQTSSAQQQLPDSPGKETVQKLCGSCHSANIVLGRGKTREEWGEVVASMISRGAKGTQAEFGQVVDYLTRNLPPKVAPGASKTSRRRGGGGGLSAGPDDKQVVDPVIAAQGKTLYDARCVACHGPKARGTENGPDLVRSLVVIHDRYGSKVGPFVRQGHPGQSAGANATYTQAQIEALSHFLHEQLNDTLRSGPYSKVLNVLTGDPKAGAAYFDGAGGCKGCHSPAGDLAGIASKYDPPTLQQRMLFPQTIGFSSGAVTVSKPVMVTVTVPGEAPVSGTLEKIDDFDVSMRDDSGQYHSWKRTPDLKIERRDPYAAHFELLDRYTDKDIHDLVAYLETLK